MARNKYLSNKELLKEIHKSKVSYCEFDEPHYHQFDTIVENYDDMFTDEALADATGVTISIVDPDGTVQVNASAMSKTATGVYEYYYDTTSSSVAGEWRIEVISTNSSRTSYHHGHFTLSAGINE